MASKRRFQLVIVSVSALLAASLARADDGRLPAVQIGGEFYQYAEAVKLKGGKVSSNPSGEYTVDTGTEKVPVKNDGTGLASVRAALFPETVLVSFTFKDTLGLAKTYINSRGPVTSIHIDKKGNGQGSVYLSSSAKAQRIELKSGKSRSAGAFDVGEDNRVTCAGRDKLECR